MNSSDKTLGDKHDVDYYSPEDGGGVMEEGNCKDGNKDGLWTYWYWGGQKGGESHYKDGEIAGTSTEWDREGNITSTETWKDGELVK